METATRSPIFAVNTHSNDQLDKIDVRPVSLRDAKLIIVARHYMKTWPSGAAIAFGVFYENKCNGIVVFGKSSATVAKVLRVCDLDAHEYLEMQRMWISDYMGHNTESKTLSLIMKAIKKRYPQVKLIITHAGGCKNDCGIVYQSSAWLYFGKSKCDDFFYTADGEYKNIAAALRFGRVKGKGKTKQQIGEELFGRGEIIKSFRYTYVYPIAKNLRRKLTEKAQPYPKQSANFRYNQKWI